jgi:hypothetical protein
MPDLDMLDRGVHPDEQEDFDVFADRDDDVIRAGERGTPPTGIAPSSGDTYGSTDGGATPSDTAGGGLSAAALAGGGLADAPYEPEVISSADIFDEDLKAYAEDNYGAGPDEGEDSSDYEARTLPG